MKDVLDTRMIIWIVSMIFFAGGGWHSLSSLGDRVSDLEDRQDMLSQDIRSMMANQAAICQATGADCER
jgi:hypothetical protein